MCLCYLKVLHNLSVWTATDKNMDYDKAKETAKSGRKESKLVRKNIPTKISIKKPPILTCICKVEGFL